MEAAALENVATRHGISLERVRRDRGVARRVLLRRERPSDRMTRTALHAASNCCGVAGGPF